MSALSKNVRLYFDHRSRGYFYFMRRKDDVNYETYNFYHEEYNDSLISAEHLEKLAAQFH